MCALEIVAFRHVFLVTGPSGHCRVLAVGQSQEGHGHCMELQERASATRSFARAPRKCWVATGLFREGQAGHPHPGNTASHAPLRQQCPGQSLSAMPGVFGGHTLAYPSLLGHRAARSLLPEYHSASVGAGCAPNPRHREWQSRHQGQ